MAIFDKAIIVAYSVAMTVILVIGSYTLDLPIFILGAVGALVSAVAIIKKANCKEPDVDDGF